MEKFEQKQLNNKLSSQSLRKTKKLHMQKGWKER